MPGKRRPHRSGTFEVISLNGTLELTGGICISPVSDPYGAMLGGHMMPGCTVRTRWSWLSAGCAGIQPSTVRISGYDELHISSVN